MKASETKELTKQKEQEYIESWWNEIKGELFKVIKYQAEQRKYSTSICFDSEVNFDTNFLTEMIKIDKMVKELIALGYDAYFDVGDYENNCDSSCVQIQWS